MRGAVRNKERWERRRTPTQDPSTEVPAARAKAQQQQEEETGERSADGNGSEDTAGRGEAASKRPASAGQGSGDASAPDSVERRPAKKPKLIFKLGAKPKPKPAADG